MSNDKGNEYISCVNRLNNCNVILPGKLNNINKNPNTGLPFTTQDKEAIYSQYNRICNQNEGNVTNCCIEGMEPVNDEENYVYETIKSKYPTAKLFKNKNGDIIQILLSKYKLEQFNSTERQYWTELSPYILCKIYNAEIHPLENNQNNKDYILYKNLVGNCLNSTCQTLEQELTLNHLVGDINSELNYTYIEDQSLVERIKEGDLDSIKNYVLKYKSVNNPLTHDYKKDTMLHIASKTDHTKVMDFLLKLRAKTNAEDFYGETPIFNAVRFNKINNIEAITKQDHNSVIHSNKEGQTPIYIAIGEGNKNILLYLFNKGASLVDKDNLGNNLIHHSIIHHPKHEVIKFLVTRGVSLTENNNKGQTPLDLVKNKIKKFKNCNKDNQNNKVDYKRLNNYRQAQFFDEKTYSEELSQLNSILTYINKSMFIEKNDSYSVQDMTSDFESSPVELQDFVCYKKIKFPTDNRSQTIENVKSRDECTEKGGYPIDYKEENEDEKTKVDITYYKEEDLDKLKNDDLFYKQNYEKIQRRPDYVQEVLEEEHQEDDNHAHCNLNNNNKKVIESFLNAKTNQSKMNLEKEMLKKNKATCPLVPYTKYIVMFILFGLILVFIRNN